jgi:hypothetical protein
MHAFEELIGEAVITHKRNIPVIIPFKEEENFLALCNIRVISLNHSCKGT